MSNLETWTNFRDGERIAEPLTVTCCNCGVSMSELDAQVISAPGGSPELACQHCTTPPVYWSESLGQYVTVPDDALECERCGTDNRVQLIRDHETDRALCHDCAHEVLNAES